MPRAFAYPLKKKKNSGMEWYQDYFTGGKTGSGKDRLPKVSLSDGDRIHCRESRSHLTSHWKSSLECYFWSRKRHRVAGGPSKSPLAKNYSRVSFRNEEFLK